MASTMTDARHTKPQNSEPPSPPPVADPTLGAAMSAMPIYMAGIRFDGTPALSYESGVPGDATDVGDQ